MQSKPTLHDSQDWGTGYASSEKSFETTALSRKSGSSISPVYEEDAR